VYIEMIILLYGRISKGSVIVLFYIFYTNIFTLTKIRLSLH